MTEPRALLEHFEPAFVRVVSGAGVIAAFAAVAAGAPLPLFLRLAIAVVALSFWPGAMLLRFLVDREVEGPGRIATSFVLGLGLACALAWAAHEFGFDYGVGLWLLPLLGLALACVRPWRPVEAPEPRSMLPWALLATWVVLVTIVVGSLGAPLMTDTDSLDHIGTVRRIADTRVVFPTDAFFADAGPHGADPRKGLYHAWVAMVVRGARVDPVEAWRWLPALLIPVFVLAVSMFTFALTGSRMTSLVAGILFPLLYGGGLGGTELRETVYSTRVGEIAALVAAATLVRFVERGGRRRLLFWIALAWTALAIHVWYALYFALAFGVYAAGTLYVRRNRETLGRFAAAFGGLAVPALPYLLFRATQSYGPQNEIHTEPQGLFYLSDRLYTVDPQAIWTWNGLGLVAALAAAPWFWSRRHASTGAIYLALVPWAVIAIVLNPFVLPLAHRTLGYLTMRLIWIVPVIPILATILTAMGEKAVRGAGRGRRLAWAGLAAFGLWLLPQVGQAVSLVTERDRLRSQEAARGVESWRDVLDWLRTSYPGPRVFVSDPATCYSIPAWTGHHVSAFLDQHSSPNDPRALERILAARDILSPYVDERRTLELLRTWGIDAVFVNQRFQEPMVSDYWTVSPALYTKTRAKFEARPEWFRRVFAADGAFIYELTPAAKSAPLPPPREPARPAQAVLAAAPRPAPPDSDAVAGARGIVLEGARTERTTYAPGDTLRFISRWSATGTDPIPPGSYTVYVRVDGGGYEGPLYTANWQKPYRKLVERLTGRKWRVRESHRILDGIWSPDQWRPREVVADSTAFTLPADLAPGDYVVSVKLVRMPHYANTRLRDYLRDDDLFAGPPVARIRVAEVHR